MRQSSIEQKSTPYGLFAHQPTAGKRPLRTRLALCAVIAAAAAVSACQGTTSGKSHYGEFRKSTVYGVGNQR